MRFAMLVLSGWMAVCASSAMAQSAAPRTVAIVDANGRPAGQATFTEGPKGVMIRLQFPAGALPPGWHGLHVHEHGDCRDSAAGFHAAGGHIGMSQHVQHGLMNAQGPEAGDLPNLFAASSGPFEAEVFAPNLTLGSVAVGARQPLLDSDGAALIIHANADDQVSQPIGNAGARIACAALTPAP